ncbi:MULTISPECIES: thioredoxin domain-containing protein [Corynebacterium]|uniref:DsbA family protein n=1 Tax=Corynebacterium TaxID=1716 RepID=UPI001EF351EB|nr:thioredoxin domain-containing protein [Corynebacterium sp. Marseille-P8863]MCG7254128.1 thioredoxin domain-containing protein [Corynebacterium hadale]MCG7256509.1 thioredoxin domain-containing protein [Corynebacterium hadale]MCG7264849.1 thioredoxin domain-containing protein [Corynebacterium hadale]
MSDTKIPPLMWAFTAVLAIGTGVGGYLIGNQTATPPAATETAQQSTQAEAPKVDVARREADDAMALGDVDAPVVISEFSDWACPYCMRFAAQTMPEIVEQYVDTGKVRFEMNDFVINGQGALNGARAGRAAADQGKFFEFQEAYVAAASKVEGHPDFSLDELAGFAKEAGVPDLEQFRSDAESDKYDQALSEANTLAQQSEVTATPTFIINGQVLEGALPFEKFAQVIDAELEKAGA